MTFEKTYIIEKDHQLIIKLPESFKAKGRVKVTVEDAEESRETKINILKKAVDDPLFLSDSLETISDFEHADFELL